MKKVLLTVLVAICLSSYLMAQDHNHDHDHSQDSMLEHPVNEIGIGQFISYLASEKEYAYGLHIHYLRAIKGSKFGFGIAYEQVFDEHIHRTAGIVGSYRPLAHFVFTVSPGILFPNSENPLSRFVMHTEIVYEFEIGHFHLGPSIEFATTFKEFHLGAGLHLGYAF